MGIVMRKYKESPKTNKPEHRHQRPSKSPNQALKIPKEYYALTPVNPTLSIPAAPISSPLLAFP
jgi:hypothetical protein